MSVDRQGRRQFVQATVRLVRVAALADDGSSATLRVQVVDGQDLLGGEQLRPDAALAEENRHASW